MARTGKWPARISLALSVAMIAALFSVISASGQQSSGAALPTIGVDVQSASITQATYSLVVRNQGTAPSTNVTVRSTVPQNTTFESSEPAPSATTSPGTGASCDNAGVREAEGTTCQWNLGTIPPGESRTIIAIYNLNQTNTPTDRIEYEATVRDNEGHSNADTDDSLVRQRASINDDTFVNDNEPSNTNHGACNFLRVLQDDTVTAYADADTLLVVPAATGSSTNSLESFYAAQLRFEVLDTTYSSATPGSIGVHRIVSGEWSQGSGTCPGSPGEGDQPRTGFEPTSAATPTSTARIDAAPAIANWDVTADLDSPEDRGGFQGWEIRDATEPGGQNATRFHAVESGGTDGPQDPRVFLVYTTAESPTCLDLDPESATVPVGSEHGMTVLVTDGAKTPAPGNEPGSSTGPGGDACNGAPVAASVEWEIEDDTPDIYFSSQEGSPIPKTISNNNATPNSIETSADTNGVTSAGVRLNSAPASGADSTNRIEARIEAAEDPDPSDESVPVDPCSAPVPPPETNCSGETAQVDDVSVTWGTASGSASATTGGGTSTSASPSPSGSSPSSSPSGSPSSPSPSGSTSASPSPSESSASPSGSSPTGSTTSATSSTSSSPSESSRTISLFASENKVVHPGQVTLTGQIVSPDPSCEDAGEFVQIQRRILGESEYSDLNSRNTDAEGRYEINIRATESAEYIAVAPRHDQCAEATSSSETVLVQVKITARSGRRGAERGTKVGIVGRVEPDHDGTTVVLKRKKGDRYVRAGRDNLNVRSRFRFVIKVNWRGKRVFRIVWNGQDEDHARNRTKKVVIRGH